LLSPAYQANPKSASSPNDTQRSDGYRLRPGIALPVTDTLRIEAEVALEQQDSHYNYASFGSEADRARDNWSLTPRLRWQHGLGGLKSETVAGIDYYSGKVNATYTASANQSAKQDSLGFYFQNTTEFGAGWAGTVGARNQRVDQSASQDPYLGFFGPQPGLNDSADYSKNAWDLGLTYSGSGWRTYGKAGTTFRFATTDELFGYDPLTGNPTFAGNLKPQTGTLGEIGGSLALGPLTGRAALYLMNLNDEIAYDGAVFSNVNLAPTRRQGLELEADWRIVPSLLARVSYTYAASTFREGIYDGNQVPLVPKNKAALRLSWDGDSFGQYTAIANYIGQRYYSGDYRKCAQHAGRLHHGRPDGGVELQAVVDFGAHAQRIRQDLLAVCRLLDLPVGLLLLPCRWSYLPDDRELQLPLMPNRRRAVLILATLMLLALASFWAALAVGSIAVAPGDIIAGLLGARRPGADIINELRLPRAWPASPAAACWRWLAR
jgi:iron complex outermembrane receptor protein